MEELERLTRRLVAIPSHEEATDVGDEIEAWMRRETAATVRRDAVGNVIATRGVGPESLALVGHHDVVPPDDEQLDDGRYRIERRDGRLYGRGTADMKGAVAAAMLAFRDAEPASQLAFASFVGEETGGRGARHALEAGFQPTFAIVGEGSTTYSGPDVTDVVVAHRGRRESEVIAAGRSSHAGEPAAGENAIYRACEAIQRLRGVEPPRTTVLGRELTGSATVTVIDAGGARNVIPDRCRMIVDERTVPGERIPLSVLEEARGMSVSIEQDLPPMACDNEAFAERLREVASAVQDETPALVTKPHATDAGWLAEAGVTSVVVGPAEPGEAHTAEESVSLSVLERCYRLYRAAGEMPLDGL